MKRLSNYQKAMMPFYVFVVAVILFAAGRRITNYLSPEETTSGIADCEEICGRFSQCMSSVLAPEQYKQYSFLIASGCRNGCAKQKGLMGSCFTEKAQCMEIAQCIGSKLR